MTQPARHLPLQDACVASERSRDWWALVRKVIGLDRSTMPPPRACLSARYQRLFGTSPKHP